ncbi:MAG: PTS sugar transporter subunit IIA [Planctomycetota bacterium]|jgi:PTS system fructose-specific IIA component/PTS system nitrogen regulatory IIA component|nr:PTS sugar transporter subunit IIA [Planctomycetota bacterium]MDP7130409.1 PTS sugar transporter subunit IIA [Planctomycetota bacterium]
MDLTDFLIEEALISELQVRDKEAVIKELVRSLTESNAIKDEDESSVVDALMKREELGSTGIGQGVAVPHARHPAIKELVGVFGHSTAGVDFNALDGEPVHAIFLLLSPVASSGEHLQALALISRMLRNDNFCQLLRETTGNEDLTSLLRDANVYLT